MMFGCAVYLTGCLSAVFPKSCFEIINGSGLVDLDWDFLIYAFS